MLRVASIAFLLATVSVGIAWLSLQPLLVRLFAIARDSGDTQIIVEIRRALPLLLGLDLVLVAAIIFAVLQLTLSRVLLRTERAIERLAQVDGGQLSLSSGDSGPVSARVERAVARALEALRHEQETTRRQLGELRDANLRLTRAQTELVASERLATVGRLAAGVAHEVGNPLSGILGYLSLARDREKDPVIADFLVRIEAEVHRIDQIVRGLLDLGRPGRALGGAVDVQGVLTACVQLLAKAQELRDVRLELEVPSETLARGDAGALSQIAINLLLNAGQAMGGSGVVRIWAERTPGGHAIHVDDSGPGIPAEVLPRLFEPFFTTRHASRGTGLGLAVSQHLAQSMQGTLRAQNRPGGGARFTLELPAA